MSTRRLIAAIGALGLGATALAGCVSSKGGSSDDTGTASASAKQSGQKVSLTFSSSAFQPGTIKATDAIVKAWNAAHPDIQVTYQKVSPDDAHDKLVTQFAGGTAPDVIQNEAADNAGFSRQGYLADLKSMIPASLKSDIPQGVWDAVTVDGKTTSVPYMAQMYVVFANTKLLKAAGIPIPTGAGQGWTWPQLMANAKKLTKKPAYGFAWALKQPAQGMVSMALGYDGKFFSGDGAKPTINVGDNETKVAQQVHQMLLTDKTMSPSSVSLGGSDLVAGFLGGRYATMLAGNYVATEIAQKAPQGLDWTMLPLMKGTSSNQSANPQTFSISRQSKHQQEAMQFIQFVMQAKNIASLAEADALIPVTDSAAKLVKTKLGSQHGWAALLDSTKSLVNAPAYQANKFTDWKTGVANPAFQEYFAGRKDLNGLKKQLTDGWNRVNK